MNIRFLFIGLFVFTVFSCEDPEPMIDPCDIDMNALDCSTGDFDGDGVLNGEDSSPSDPCAPNLPSFEANLIGQWSWISPGIGAGEVTFNEDGTYEETMGELISNGDIVSRMWRIEDGSLVFDVENASLTLAWLEDYDCDSFTLDAQGYFPNLAWTRN